MNITEQIPEEQLFDLEKIAPLKELQKFQILRYELLQLETKRLARKLGKGHPQIQQLKARTSEQLHTLNHIEKDLELSKIRVPDVPEDGALVHGRVLDKRTGLGIVGLIVFAQDDNEKPLRAFGKVETNTSGYYALQLAKDLLKKLEEKDVYLTIATRQRKIIHQETKPLALKPGAQLKVNLSLDRSTLRPTSPPPKRPTPPKTPTKKAPTSEARDEKKTEEQGQTQDNRTKVDIGDLRGVGPKIAEKLREAGINNVESFVDTIDDKLEGLVGKANLNKVKKLNKTLLDRIRKIYAKRKKD